MKHLVGIILLWVLSMSFAGCSSVKHQSRASLQTIDGREMLIGPVMYRDVLHYFPEWAEEDRSVEIQEAWIQQVKQITEPVEVVCYFGTWCSDSRHGMPPFLRVLAQAQNPNISLTLIAVNREKNIPESAVENQIERVPTFILKQNGAEFARLVEFPMNDNFVLDFIEIVGN